MTDKSMFNQVANEHYSDELFEIYLRPMKSKKARTLFKIFVNMKEVEFLTTLDLQTKLDELEIKRSKKEINGWLRSLQDAGLISKEEERGKPTTIRYDDKYTFDMWSITPKGEEIAEGLNQLMNGKTRLPVLNPENFLEKIAQTDENKKQHIVCQIQEVNAQLVTLRNLWREGSILKKSEFEKGLVSADNTFERAVSTLLAQRLIEKVEYPRTKNLILRFLRFVGLSAEKGVPIRLTEKGRNLSEELWPTK